MTDDELNEALGLTAEDYAAWKAMRRECCDRTNGDLDEERLCSEGCCVEWWCYCGTYTGSGYGPAGCSCQDEPSLWDRFKRIFKRKTGAGRDS